MSDDTILAPPPIEPIKLQDVLEERYLAYAVSTITQRALPDVRDGLKPAPPLALRYAAVAPRPDGRPHSRRRPFAGSLVFSITGHVYLQNRTPPECCRCKRRPATHLDICEARPWPIVDISTP